MANDLISRNALIAEYDRVHIGPPGGARKLMEDAPAVQKWIPVTERLPEKDVLVLCVGARGGMFIGYPQWVYEDEKVAYTRVPNSRHGRQTKYWMPLPEPPKGESKNA